MAQPQKKLYYPSFDLQGHRGARGMFPENTLPAFMAALQQGVTTIELDVVITADKQVLVSHEPYFSPEICLGLEGEEIKNEKQYNLYKMMYVDVAACDCGSKMHERFPEQVKIKINKPLLRDVIVQVEDFIKNKTKYEVDYNIEIKSVKGEEGISQPDVNVFSDLVIQLIDEYLPLDRVVIQSFDFRVLQYIKKKYPQVRLALLIENKL
ncbi:MAG: glycerophosphodiester phosphodiesterase family protein, partial [Chryseotalea sp.]